MKLFSKWRILMGIVCVGILVNVTSCNRLDQDTVRPLGTISDDSLTIYTSFLKTNGFYKEEITFDSKKQIFIIGGDMHSSLNDVRNRYRLNFLNKGARPSQWRYTYIVSQSLAKHIKIYVDSDIPSNWVGGINDAIDYWNDIHETQVQFKLTSNSSEAQIQISSYQDSPSTIAVAELPQSSGQTGSYLKINTDGNQYYSGNSTFLKNVITHELGHNIGLMHTDYNYNVGSDPNYNPSAQFIPGTSQPGQDTYSIMNHAVDDQLEFTSSDLIAVRYLYPFTWSALLDTPRGYPDEVGAIYITWDNSVDNSTVKIELYDENDDFVTQLASAAPNSGNFRATNLSINGGFYRVKLAFNSNSSHSDFSDDLFYFRYN